MMSRIAAFLGAVLVLTLLTPTVQASLPLSSTEFVNLPSAQAPFVETVAISDAGEYVVTITDFGVDGTPIAPAAAVRLFALSEDGQTVLDVSDVGVTTGTLEVGNLTIALLVDVDGAAEGASIGITLHASGATQDVFSTVQAISNAPVLNNPSSSTERFSVPNDGTYRIQLGDLRFPNPVHDLQGLVLNGPGGAVIGVVAPDAPLDVVLSAGDSPEVTVIATRSSDADRSSYDLRVVSVDSDIVFQSVTQVGDFSEVVSLPVAGLMPGEQAEARLIDFGFPASLEQLRGLLTAGTDSVDIAAGAVSRFTPTTEDATVQVSAAPGTIGAAGVRIEDANSVIVDSIVTLEPQPELNEAAVIDRVFDVPVAGEITVEVRDFAIPQVFDNIVAAVIRDGAIVAELRDAGLVSFTATPGTYQLSVVGQFTALGGAGTLGVSVTDAGGNSVLSTEASAGGLLDTTELVIDVAQRLRISARDLQLPAALDDLTLTLTQGADILGSILGGGEFDITLSPGVYRISVVASPDATVGLGAYRLDAAALADPPELTLEANNTSVPNGGSVTLEWSTQRATSCTASGAWSGSRATAGTETISGLQSTSEFRLDCTGEGGVVSDAIQISIRATSSVSGGGLVGPLSSIFLAILALIAYRTRTQVST